MATGTGKTYTAFNIIWRLWKSGQAKRVLFLADRNILVDQTIVNDFKPFGEAMTKLTRKLVDRGSGRVDQSYEIYLVALPGDHGRRGARADLRQVPARLLRPDRDRRVPPRQRPRGLGVAGGPRLLRLGHPARHDGHAEGDEVRLEHPLLRRARLHLLAEAGHRGRLPRPVQGGPHRPRQGRARLAAREGPGRRPRLRHPGPDLQPARLRPRHHVPRPHEDGRRADRLAHARRRTRCTRRSCSARTSTTPSGCAQALVNVPENAPLVAGRPPLRDADHRRRDGGQGAARQLHRPEAAVPGDRHDVEADDHRRRRADLPRDRARPAHPVAHRVQADHRPRHAAAHRLREVLLHDPRLPQGHRAVRRPRLGRPAAPGRRRSTATPPPPADARRGRRVRPGRIDDVLVDPDPIIDDSSATSPTDASTS